jgi:soluble P-type ATPase
MKYEIPADQFLDVDTIVLDLNGTLTIGGVLVEGVKQRIEILKKEFRLYRHPRIDQREFRIS